MDAGHTNIQDSVNTIHHGFSSQGSFFGNRYVAGSSRDGRDAAGPAFAALANDTYQTRSLVPFGIGCDVSYVSECICVCPSHQDVWGTRQQSLNDADNLGSCLALAENYFRKTLACCTRMIYARISQVFVVKILDVLCSFSSAELVALVSLNKFFKLF